MRPITNVSQGGSGMRPISSVSQGDSGPVANVSKVGSTMESESGVSQGMSGMEPLDSVSQGGSAMGLLGSMVQAQGRHEYQATLAAAPLDNYQGQFDSQTRSQSSFQTDYSRFQHPQTTPNGGRDIPAQSHNPPVSSPYHPVSGSYQPHSVPQLPGEPSTQYS